MAKFHERIEVTFLDKKGKTTLYVYGVNLADAERDPEAFDAYLSNLATRRGYSDCLMSWRAPNHYLPPRSTPHVYTQPKRRTSSCDEHLVADTY